MRWWGWGDGERRIPLGAEALEMLRAELGDPEPSPAVAVDAVTLPEAAPIPAAIADVVGERHVRSGARDRLAHSAGMGYPDLVRLRSGRVERAPDAVVSPGSAAEVAAVIEACSRDRVAVVPFGGGTSVVGGVEPVPGDMERLVSLDLARLTKIEVDERSLIARLGPGLRGPAAEAGLAAAGVTLGHFPQSFEYATIGGFAATRSAGQASSGYGRFDALVTSVSLAAPAGPLETVDTPHSAAGPALRELVIGSEGVLGVITEVGVRVRAAPERRRYEAWMAPSFEQGVEIARLLAQSDVLPDVLRLSDRDETRVSLALSGTGGATRRAFDLYLRARRRSDGCVVITGWEGEREAVARRRALAARVLREGGAVPIGRRAGEAWRRGRYEGPYLRDELLDLGVMVETLETAHTWSGLEELHRSVRGALHAALDDLGTPGLVMCHVSHVYRDGASLYFTFLARQRRGEEIEQWRAAKTAASEAIVRTGGTITHHHGIGRDHAPYMRAEVGELGLEALRAVKERLDPAGIMNPGKLVG